jgi:hypothetical protein
VPVIIIGKSGSGKSTSLRNFTECGLINVLGKPLPFKSDKKYITTDSYEKVKSVLSKAQAKSVIIDDAGYLITNYFMSHHSTESKGNDIFKLYNDLGDQFWGIIRFVQNVLSADKIVYFMMHEDHDDYGNVKPKTIGKLLDEKVCLEGMVTVLIRCVAENGAHKFLTNGDGIEKSPIGMFENSEVDNDLKMVDTAIRSYWGLTNIESEETVNE